MSKGHLSVSIGAVAGLIAGIISGVSVYFGTINAQDNKISLVKEDINSAISEDRQQIAKLQNQSDTYKDDITSIKADIKEILKAVGGVEKNGK